MFDRIKCLFSFVLCITVPMAGLWAESRVGRDDDGLLTIETVSTPEHLKNPWPSAWEETYLKRRSAYVDAHPGGIKTNTSLENEKAMYPSAMFTHLKDDPNSALEAFMRGDNQAGDNKLTNGIDFYWCFTLKPDAQVLLLGTGAGCGLPREHERGWQSLDGNRPTSEHRVGPPLGLQ